MPLAPVRQRLLSARALNAVMGGGAMCSGMGRVHRPPRNGKTNWCSAVVRDVIGSGRRDKLAGQPVSENVSAQSTRTEVQVIQLKIPKWFAFRVVLERFPNHLANHWPHLPLLYFLSETKFSSCKKIESRNFPGGAVEGA